MGCDAGNRFFLSHLQPISRFRSIYNPHPSNYCHVFNIPGPQVFKPINYTPNHHCNVVPSPRPDVTLHKNVRHYSPTLNLTKRPLLSQKIYKTNCFLSQTFIRLSNKIIRQLPLRKSIKLSLFAYSHNQGLLLCYATTFEHCQQLSCPVAART